MAPPAPVVIRRRASAHTISILNPGLEGPSYVTHDVAPYFTVTRDRNGLNAHRAGEYQEFFVNPVKRWLFG